MKMMNNGLLGVLIFVVILIAHGNASASASAAVVKKGLSNDSVVSSVTAMFVLGDSSVDCGENTPFYSLLHQNFSLYPCNGSDATLLPQLLAKKMGLPYTTPFYSQNGSIQGLLSGVNFGSAQATIMYTSSLGYQSLNQQLRQTFETIQLLQLQIGEEIANHFIESSLFYLSFGQDDFISYFFHNSSGVSHEYRSQNFSHILVNQMANAIRSLYTSNVKKIVCTGILPLGCAPRIVWKLENSTAGNSSRRCVNEVNKYILEYNTGLEEKIVALNAELTDARIVFCDVFGAIMEVINKPHAYGIQDVNNACCGLGKYGGMSGCLSRVMACHQASTHLWWDYYNPTPTINSLLANSAWSGRPFSNVCRPTIVKKLVSS